jgi:hypothetical protein
MTINYRNSAGVDFDSLFKIRTGTAGANTGYRSNTGVDLAQRFEQRGSTTAIANTGFRNSSGVDLSQLFMDISAVIITMPGNGAVWLRPTSPTVIAFNSDGSVSYASGTSNDSYVSWGPGGSGYDIRITATSGSFTTGSNGVWENLGSSRVWEKGAASGIQSVTFTVEIRDSSTLTVLGTSTGCQLICDLS